MDASKVEPTITGEGPVVVLVHPLGADRRYWNSVVESLPGRTLITYDLPGHGGTPPADEQYSIEELGEQLLSMMTGLGHQTFSIVGVSIGGLVAQAVGAVAPERLQSLVLADTVAVYPPDFAANLSARSVSVLETGTAGLVDATLAMWFTADYIAADGSGVGLVRSMLASAHPQGYAQACRALVEAMGNAFQSRELVMTTPVDQLLATAVAPTGQRVTRASSATGGNHTAAVTCVDAEQNVISLLVSIYQEFGCFEYIHELGFFVNNRLKGADLAPLSEDRRPIHTLSPMILETPEAVIALATPGADAQVQVLAQVIDDILAHGSDIGAAIDSPRWRLQDGYLLCEEGMDPERISSFEQVGHEVHPLPFGHMNFGAVAIAGFADDRPFSIADRRRSYSADAI